MSDNAQQPTALSAETEAAIRERRAFIPNRLYKVIPEHGVWSAIGLQDPDDPECFNIVAEVNHAQYQHGNVVDDQRKLPEFFAEAPADIDALLLELDRLRAELATVRGQRDSALAIANGLDAALETEGINDVIAQLKLSVLRGAIDRVESGRDAAVVLGDDDAT